MTDFQISASEAAVSILTLPIDAKIIPKMCQAVATFFSTWHSWRTGTSTGTDESLGMKMATTSTKDIKFEDSVQIDIFFGQNTKKEKLNYDVGFSKF